MKKQLDDIQKKHQARKTNIDHTISTINLLITRVRDVEEQIQTNAKQPINDYDKLLLDCQVRLCQRFE